MSAEESTLEFIVSVKGGPEGAAEVDKVKAAVAGAGGTIKQFGGVTDNASKSSKGFTSGLKGMLVQLGLISLAYKGYGAAKNAITWTDQLVTSTNKLTKSTGLSVEKASQYLTVTEALNIPTSALSTAFNKLSKDAVTQADAHGKTITAFDRLGISEKFVNEHTHDFNGLILETAQRLKELPAGFHKASIEQELFGRGATQLGPLLGEGAKGIERLLGTAKKYGAEIKGKSIAEELDKLKQAQLESTLATDGLRISFTKLAGPSIVQALQMFARLKNDLRTGNMGAFDKEIGKGAEVLEKITDEWEVKTVESFGQLAPRLLKAFVNGFVHASLGNEILISGLIISKMGLKDAAFDKLGHSAIDAFLSPFRKGAGARVAGDAVAEDMSVGASGGFSKAGTAMGLVMGASLIAAVVLLAKTQLGHEVEEALGLRHKEKSAMELAIENPASITPESLAKMTPAQRKELRHIGHIDTERHYPKVLYDSQAKLQKTVAHEHKSSAAAMREVEAQYNHPKHRKAHGAFGAEVLSPGLVEVGERGPELLHLPPAATVAPMKPGSLGDNRDIVIKVDGRVLARVNRRQQIQSEAAGA